MDWSAIGDVFGKGLDAYVDLETSKNFAANSTLPGTRDQYGNAVGVGQSAYLGALTSNPAVLIGVIALVGLVLVMAMKR